MSIEGWVNYSSLDANMALASKGDIGVIGGPWALRWTNDNVLHLYISDGSTTSDSTVSWTPSTGTWYHVAATHDTSGNVKFYINGVQQGTTQTGARTAIAGADTNSFFIGGYSTTGGTTVTNTTITNGNISLVRFWSSVRTVTEINDNKCNVFGGAQTNMIGEWSLDNVLTDASGNGFTLTNNGSATFTSSVPSTCSASTINSNFFALMN